MSGSQHHYEAKIVWTGAEAGPAEDVRTFSREHRIEIPGKEPIRGSSDPAFRGDPALHNPEDLLVASLSACHMLWYLALCAAKGITVHAYEDTAEGVMVAEPRNGRFTEVTLRPVVTIGAEDDTALALALHDRAHAECFVANSVNFPVHHDAKIVALTAEQA